MRKKRVPLSTFLLRLQILLHPGFSGLPGMKGVILPELSSCPCFFGKLTSFWLQHLSDPLESKAQSWSSACPTLCPGCTIGEHRPQMSKTEHTCGR